MKSRRTLLITGMCLIAPSLWAQKNPFHSITDGTINENKKTEVENVAIPSADIPAENDVYSEEQNKLTIEELERLIEHYERMQYPQKAYNRTGHNKVYSFYTGESHELTLPNLISVMQEVGVSNQLFVLAQAVLETGHFTSRVCKENNNLFGIRLHHSYAKFERWEDSVVGYKNWIQYKYKGGNYLTFLKRIGYAEAPHYTQHVAKIARQLYETLKAEGRFPMS